MASSLPRCLTDKGTAFVRRGDGEVLVFLHGVGLCADAWAVQLDAFQADYQVIVPDLPGHGTSSLLTAIDQKAVNLTHYVAWLHEALHEWEVNSVNLVGHSLGALIALGFALTYPRSVKRLALLNGVYNRSITQRQALLRRVEEWAAGDKAITLTLNRWFGQSADANATMEAIRAQAKQWLLVVDDDGYLMAYRAFATGDNLYTESLSELSCPAIFITGEEDVNSTPAMSQTMAQQVSDGEVAIIPGHRHLVHLTAADVVNTLLSNWLQKSRGQSN